MNSTLKHAKNRNCNKFLPGKLHVEDNSKDTEDMHDLKDGIIDRVTSKLVILII